MKININWEKAGLISIVIIGVIYTLFLVIPLVLSPIANSYSNQLKEIIKISTGLDAEIQGLGVTTSPKLTIGVKVREFSLYSPDDRLQIFELENARISLKLFPLLFKRIELGDIKADEIEGNIVLKKNGMPVLLDYIPEQNEENPQPLTSLPFGLKISNNLPNVKINEYKIKFTDDVTKKIYYINGKNLKISDFVLDKKIKVSTNGEIIFGEKIISKYNIKIFNKIMPNIVLDDLIFPKEIQIADETEQKENADAFSLNLIDIFESIDKNGLKLDLNTDIKTSGSFKNPVQKGCFELNGVSVLVNGRQLPESYAKLIFKGKQTDIDSLFYTSSDINEKTHLTGNIKSGNKPSLNLTLRSNAKFNNIIRLIDSIAQSFGINDLKTITATGGVNADLSISSDMKTVSSAGYLKIPSSSVNYGLYNISISDINGDINLDNNIINVKNLGFSVMEHPLNITGKISSDAIADFKITADKLSLKGLIGAAGQVNLLKENNFNSGTLSLNATLKGALTDIKPDITLCAENINIYNKLVQARLLLNKAVIKLVMSNNLINGDIDLNSLKIQHNSASVSVPKAKVSMDSKDINIKKSYVMINNSKVDVSGIVKDYSNEKADINILAKGDLSSKDVAMFIPKEFRSMFPYKGSMPLNIAAKGNDKIQHITFDLTANSDGYVKFLDIDRLKGKNTKIHADVKVENNSLAFENSGIYAGSNQIASFNGGVKNLSDPNLNINLSVPENISFPIPGIGNNSNITANGNVTIFDKPLAPKLKGKVNIADISIKDMDFALSNLTASLNGQGISGNASAEKMKFGGIIGTNLSSEFSLNNFSIFNLNNIKADAFSGKIVGKISYDIPKFAFGLDITGNGLNSTDAVYGAVGIPKALTGTMGFDAKLTSKGITDVEILKNMKGNINFNIENGRFISIGRLENFVSAQNITSNSILKSAISALTTAHNIQETNKFKSIAGEIAMLNGNANLSYINVAGPLMSYYVKGVYNILSNNANLIILGRIDSKIVSYLGPVGQLSVEKLISYIPNFGQATAKYLKLLTQDPANEQIQLIPSLTSGSESYKDFKVIFNGSIEKTSSVKSFKWLSTCDTTEIDLKQETKNAINAAKENVKGQVQSVKNTAENVKTNVTKMVENEKQKVETEKKVIEQAKSDVKNIKQNAGQNASNLGKLLFNAASNTNKKMETTPAKSEPETSQKSEVSTTASDSQTKNEQ